MAARNNSSALESAESGRGFGIGSRRSTTPSLIAASCFLVLFSEQT